MYVRRRKRARAMRAGSKRDCVGVVSIEIQVPEGDEAWGSREAAAARHGRRAEEF